MSYRLTEDGNRVITEDGAFYVVTEDHVPGLAGGPEGDAAVWIADIGDGIKAYSAGQMVRCSVVFRDADGDPVDPSTVTFRVRKPDGTTTTYVYQTDPELVRTEMGSFSVDVLAALGGRYTYRFEGGGAVVASAERMFRVEAARAV
jgi:hypothetical protein